MAESIDYAPAKYDPREALQRKLKNAPQEHAEALLDAYDILQLLRDKGLLEIVKGALGSGEKVLGEVTKTLETHEAISLFRNVVILTKIIGGLNPKILEEVENAFVSKASEAKSQKPPGLLRLFGQLTNRDSRRFLGSIAAVIETVGANFDKLEEPGLRGKTRKKVTRHRIAEVADEEI